VRGAWLDGDRGPSPSSENASGDGAGNGSGVDGALDDLFAPEPEPEPQRGSWLSSDEHGKHAALTGRLSIDAAPGWATLLTIVGAIALAVMVFAALTNNDSELQTGAIVGIVLSVASVFLFRRIAKRDGTPGLTMMLSAALSVKIIGTYLRYQVGTSVYDRSDATQYDTYGRSWAHDYLSHGALPPVKSFTGTNFIRLVTAEVYNLVSPSMFAGFIVFSWFGFLGLLLFWRAFRKIYPENDRIYFYLVMFAPSLVYWPSSIGKEAICIFGLGLASYGFARTLTRSVLLGSGLVAAGVVLVTYVRAHVALTLLIGMFFASLIRKRPRGAFIGTVVTILIFGAVTVYVAHVANAYFKTNVSDSSQLSDSLSSTIDRTHIGNSEFNPVPIHSPADFPYAAMTVLFRPFPWEAGSWQEQATSLESIIYAGVLVFTVSRLFKRLRRDQPYALYALATTTVFIVLFSNFANFGILARQRTQVLPFLFVLMCLPPRPPKEVYVPMMQRVLARHAPARTEVG
jgi:hypothetical protein